MRISFSTGSEPHFFSASQPARLHFHSSPPFAFTLHQNDAMHIQIWKHLESHVDISIRIDWYASLGKLFLHYRGALASWPMLFALQHLLHTIRQVGETEDDTFIRMQILLLGNAANIWKKLVLFGCTMAFFQSILVSWNIAAVSASRHLLGTSHLIFLPLLPLMLCVAATAQVALRLIALVLINGLSSLLRQSRGGWLHKDSKSDYVEKGALSATITTIFTFMMLYAPTSIASACIAAAIFISASRQYLAYRILRVGGNLTRMSKVQLTEFVRRRSAIGLPLR